MAKFTCSFEAEDDEELALFPRQLFGWVLVRPLFQCITTIQSVKAHHEAEGVDARLRVCQLLNKLLGYMGEGASIPDTMYDQIYEGMLERLKDRVAEIRAQVSIVLFQYSGAECYSLQAVLALQRLQNPRDESCPVTRAYLFHLAHDVNNIVRRTIVRCIGPTKLTLPHVLERCRDVDPQVRREAFKYIAEKVHIKSLTIAQREQVLKRGLNDRSLIVKKVVEKEVISSWLRMSENDVCRFLGFLDITNSDEEEDGGQKSPSTAALHVVFSDSSYADLMTSFGLLGREKLIPDPKLTAETARYWRVLCEYLYSTNAPGSEEVLDGLLPELSVFCQYIRRIVFTAQNLPVEDEVHKEFIVKAELHTLVRRFYVW